jgi:hypothetical protein
LEEGPDGGLVVVYRGSGPSDPDGILQNERPVFAQVSDDGGQTWSMPKRILSGNLSTEQPVRNDEEILVEDPATMPGEATIVPVQNRKVPSWTNQNYVAVSDSSGGSYEVQQLGEPYTSWANFDFSLDANSNGTVVAAWPAEHQGKETLKLHVSVSRDAGQSWSPPVQVEHQGQAMQPWVKVREDGLVSIAYYGTNGTESLLNLTQEDGWHPRVTFLRPTDVMRPIETLSLTQEPIHNGVLCNGRPKCPAEHRNSPMREFLSQDWTPEGDLLVAWTDARKFYEGYEHPDGRATGDGHELVVSTVQIESNGTAGPSP